MYTSNNYLNYNTNDFSTDLSTPSSFHNVNQQFIGNHSIKNDFDVPSTRELKFRLFLLYYSSFILESNEIFCSSSTPYPTSTASFPIPPHASGKNNITTTTTTIFPFV